MSNVEQPQKDFWERSFWVWSLVFYLSLIVPFLVLWLNGDLMGQRAVWAGILSLIGCVWHWFWVWYLPTRLADGEIRPLRERPPLAAIYLIGATLIWAQLILFHGLFNFHLGGLFGQLFIFLPIHWATVGAFVITGIQIVQTNRSIGRPIELQDPIVFGPLLGVVAASLFGLWIRGIMTESYRRRDLLEQLRQAQDELAESERNAGILSERQRLAHEIHDTLAQGFIGIIMHLEAAAQTVESHPVTQKHIAQAEAMARENLHQARYLVEGLHPKKLQEASLPDAIKKAVQQWQGQSNVPTQVTITGEERPLPPQTEHTLLRATQEALANVHKHAQSTEVAITLSYMDNLVMLDVQDNGVGLNEADSQWQGGFGLTAMRERVEQVGGALLVESDDDGVTVVVSIPITNDQ